MKLDEDKKTRKEKEEQGKKDQEQMNHSMGQALGNLMRERDLNKMEKQGKKLPPYFENISKDIMIHRKLKILIKKDLMRIGKQHANPPNDIIFGGRDVEMKHA
eukprot:GHVR01102420.1.p1 GENE.GHVR01102420.1~~GHVR01102420.1.p1  ORF type:complete len:103 (+),score=20.92 GHVR01102420.1:87-395(+)